MKEVHWVLITTDRGGMVRGNVHTKSGDAIISSEDMDFPLDAFAEDEQAVLLDALQIVAEHVGGERRTIVPVPAHEALVAQVTKPKRKWRK